MSGANELLDSLSPEEIAEYSGTRVVASIQNEVLHIDYVLDDPEDEPRIIIDSDRVVTVPEELKKIAVQFDHNIETVRFECPRYWDNNDLYDMDIYVNYANGTNKGQFPVQNIAVEGDIIYFDWTLENNATKYKGPIIFLVCAKSVDEGGYDILHWNSELNRDMYVSEGLECTESVEASNPAMIDYLLGRMQRVEAIGATTEEAVRNYMTANADKFKGDKGDTGDKGDPGVSAPSGVLLPVTNGVTAADITQFDYFVVKRSSYGGLTPPNLLISAIHELSDVIRNTSEGTISAFGAYHQGTNPCYCRLIFKETSGGYTVEYHESVYTVMEWTTIAYDGIWGFKRLY